jgi:hypothetical protein
MDAGVGVEKEVSSGVTHRLLTGVVMNDRNALPKAVTYLLLFILGFGFLAMIITAVPPIMDWIFGST